ncbi:CRISPR-associated endonuclease Cas1 [Niveibacterium sp. 24ML]|uniref:CRISPR-associated endonuclease Cas1 n=1 Tax=Niveibacterium sp. 24ML TaxID=2985512 RepID=UPI0022717431|nr:CRISPR-associated endonuclease Cas1 [Niveibacterium sp. 24ML]MCX9157922.1 CRISPR-associated endonuclease Cas1 [Niveibacterium sp. 24ML]
MSTLVIDRSGFELRWNAGALELRQNGTLARTIPGKLLERIVLQSDTQLGSATLAALADQGIGLVAFGGRSGQRVAHLLGTPHNDARTRIAQCRITPDEADAITFVRQLVRGKVLRQQRFLRRAAAERPDLRKPLHDGNQTLGRTLEQIATASSINSLRGLEGAAAAAYFRAYVHLFAQSLEFNARRRRPPPDPVNACLSLGYSMLYSSAVAAAWASGLDPMIGALHTPAHGRASLACDLMEPWRPRIDQWVWIAFRERRLRPDHFGRDGAGACIIGKAARAEIYPALSAVTTDCGRAMQRHARAIAKALQTRAPILAPAPDCDEDEPFA